MKTYLLHSMLSVFVFCACVLFIHNVLADADDAHANIALKPPVEAVEVGYDMRTFHGVFSKNTIDFNKLKQPGFDWYFWDLFGKKASARSIRLESDNAVTLFGEVNKAHGHLVSAVKTSKPPYFVGKAFGGGAYIEATLKFDKDAVNNGEGPSIPAFWSLQMEGNIFEGQGQWPGMPEGYVHNIEVDFFESHRNAKLVPEHSYGASMHDWFGIWKETCPKGLCQEKMPYREGMRIVPKGTDFSEYHRYGFLWIPATEDKKGEASFFFDGQQVGPTRRWSQYEGQPPTPIGQDWAFGILDHRHLFLILSNGEGHPMTVKEVSVWQKDDSRNLVNR